jgi:hypothetical protein
VLGGSEEVTSDQVLALCAECQARERPMSQIKPNY